MNQPRFTMAAATAVFLYGARRYFRNWGTTKEECRMHLPGDELIRPPVIQTTEGISIDASVAAVWPWLVQMGQDRGGLYGYEFLENSIGLHHRNASRIHPEWQRIAPGDVIRLSPQGWLGLHDGVAFTVAEVIEGRAPGEQATEERATEERAAEERAIVLHVAPPSLPWETVWSFHLIPRGDDRCRLLIRSRVGLRRPGEVVLAEIASPVTALMTRGMLRGIQRRARDAPVRTPAASPTPL